jgi:hypothetical protein
MLPTFIVIGAMKSGTTSLYYYLDEHPEIEMSAQKETDFFIAENNYKRGLTWYESLFDDASSKARGEVSPNYTKRHLFAGVPARMKDVLPNIKLIYLLRDPIERLVSHYVGSCAEGYEDRTLPEVLADLDASNCVQTSRYFTQLKPYLAHYDREDILIITSQELRQAHLSTLQTIYQFIGVDETFENRRTKQFNPSSSLKRRSRLYRFISRGMSQSLKDSLRPYLPRRLLPGTPVPRPALSTSQQAQLAEYLAEEVRALRELTNRRLADWKL